jgi:DNA-binding MarR family transcriptional regulator
VVGLASHDTMRVWSAFVIIPKALPCEKADPASVVVRSARRWSRRSRGRLPLDVVICTAMVAALLAAARNG